MLQIERAASQQEVSELRNRIWEMSNGADDARDEVADISCRMHDALAAEQRAQVCLSYMSNNAESTEACWTAVVDAVTSQLRYC